MYQVIEYTDCRKENNIFLHGCSNNLDRAKQRALDILKNRANDESSTSFYQILDRHEMQKNYVAICENTRSVIKNELCYRKISWNLPKTIAELFEMLDEQVPHSLKAMQHTIVTKEIFRDLIHRNMITDGSLYFLHDDCQWIFIDTYSTIVAVVECEQF